MRGGDQAFERCKQSQILFHVMILQKLRNEPERTIQPLLELFTPPQANSLGHTRDTLTRYSHLALYRTALVTGEYKQVCI